MPTGQPTRSAGFKTCWTEEHHPFPLAPAPLPLSVIDNESYKSSFRLSLLLWRRGTGRGGRDFCNPQDRLGAWRNGFGRWPNRQHLVGGLLSPALSSEGG